MVCTRSRSRAYLSFVQGQPCKHRMAGYLSVKVGTRHSFCLCHPLRLHSNRGGGGHPPRSHLRSCCDGDDDESRGPEWMAFRCILIALSLASCPQACSCTLPQPLPPSSSLSHPTVPRPLGGASEGTTDDIETIRRLLRDSFEQQMHLEHRLHALEPSKVVRSSLWDGAASRALQPRWRQLDLLHSSGSPILQHQLEVAAGGGCGGMPHVDTGPRLQSCLHAEVQKSEAAVILRTIIGAGSFRLWHAQLRGLWRRCVLAVIPSGARFKDIAQPLHGGQGRLPFLLQNHVSVGCMRYAAQRKGVGGAPHVWRSAGLCSMRDTNAKK
jgi:hypothetical protein